MFLLIYNLFGWGDSGEDGKGREGNRGGFKLFGWKGKMGGILGGPKGLFGWRSGKVRGWKSGRIENIYFSLVCIWLEGWKTFLFG